MLESISNIVSQGSIILFDYPNGYDDSGKNKVLAGGSGEEMKSYYKEKDIFLIILLYIKIWQKKRNL